MAVTTVASISVGCSTSVGLFCPCLCVVCTPKAAGSYQGGGCPDLHLEAPRHGVSGFWHASGRLLVGPWGLGISVAMDHRPQLQGFWLGLYFKKAGFVAQTALHLGRISGTVAQVFCRYGMGCNDLSIGPQICLHSRSFHAADPRLV